MPSPLQRPLQPSLPSSKREQLDPLAKIAGLARRKARILNAQVLLGSCLGAVGAVASSFFSLACLAGVLAGITVSRQAMHKRFTEALLNFLKAVLGSLMRAQTGDASGLLPKDGVVRRILVADSSNIKLHLTLKEHFPGSANKCGSGAALKMQATFDLLSGGFVDFSLSGFTRNDQAAANDILAMLKPGDLVLRDLGNLTCESLRGIGEAGAFFVSRYFKMKLYSPDGSELSLGKVLLRHPCARAGTTVDMAVLLGKEGRLPVRLVAIMLDETTANERRRKARADRDKRLEHSDEFYALLDWAIYVTNLPREGYDAAKIGELYALRWRVEILFQSFKGAGLRLPEVLHGRISANQVKALTYAALILAVLNAQFFGAPVMRAGKSSPRAKSGASHGRSLLKGAKLMSLLLLPLLVEGLCAPGTSIAKRVTEQLERHGCHDQRQRPHFIAELAAAVRLS